MFCSKMCYSNITTTHKRALRAFLLDFEREYSIFVEKANTKAIHEIHLAFLANEIFKSTNMLNPSFLNEFFVPKVVRYGLLNQNLLVVPDSRTSRFGTHSFFFRGAMLWNRLPGEVKSCSSVTHFKSEIRKLSLRSLCTYVEYAIIMTIMINIFLIHS